MSSNIIIKGGYVVKVLSSNAHRVNLLNGQNDRLVQPIPL